MSFIYETHCHTCESSKCGKTDGASYARHFKSLGYSGIFITDHFFNSNIVDIPEHYSWERKIDTFARGYQNAKEEGDKIGLDVFFGWEHGFDWCHLLTYGLDIDWLKMNPDVVKWGAVEYFDNVHRSGGFVVHAHSFRDRVDKVKLFPNHTDAVEVINASQSEEANRRALIYSELMSGYVTAGSDIHDMKTTKLAGVIVEEKFKTSADYFAAMKSGKLQIFNKFLDK